MSRIVRTRAGEEQGAVVVLTALLLPVILAVGALSLGATTLWTSRQDVQRAADLGALAAAASAPTVNVGAVGAALPFGLDATTGTFLHDLLGAGDDGWNAWGCTVAGRQFTDDRSVVTRTFDDGDVTPSCTVRWEWEDPLLAALGGCAADLLDVAGCTDDLLAELQALLPVASVLEGPVDALLGEVDLGGLGLGAVTDQIAGLLQHEAITDLLDTTTAQIDATTAELLDLQEERAGLVAELQTLLDRLAALPLLGPVLRPLITPLQATIAALDQQIATVQAELDGLVEDLALTNTLTNALLGAINGILSQLQDVQVGLDLASLLPALLTPRVTVAIDDVDVRPTFSPRSFSVSTEATARRAIKSAVVLPTLGLPGIPVGSWTLDVDQLDVPGLLDLAAGVVNDIEDAVAQPLGHALGAACGGLDARCPSEFDVVDADRLFGVLRDDIADATRPAPDGSSPTVTELLQQLADSGEPTWVVSTLRKVELADLVDGDLLDVLLGSVLGPLVPDLAFIPALDILPVLVSQNPDGTFQLEPLSLADVTATRGLYQGRLVR